MVNILTIDGGGVRGVIPLRILQNIENDFDINISRDPNFIYNYFNAFGGTSIGSAIIGAIVYKKKNINEITNNLINSNTLSYIMPKYCNNTNITIVTIVTIIFFCCLGFYPTKYMGNTNISVMGGIFGIAIGILLSIIFAIIISYGFPKFPEKNKRIFLKKILGDNTKISDTKKDVLITQDLCVRENFLPMVQHR